MGMDELMFGVGHKTVPGYLVDDQSITSTVTEVVMGPATMVYGKA